MKLKNTPLVRTQTGFARVAMMVSAMLLAAVPATSFAVNTYVFSGTSAWLTAGNWTPSSSSTGPGVNDIAQSGTTIPTAGNGWGVNYNNTVNNGTLNEAVGAIQILSTRSSNFVMGNSTSATGKNGIFTFNGATINAVPNVIIENGSPSNFTVQDNNGGTDTMGMALANTTENIISLDGAGNIVISDIISSTSGTTPFTFAGSGSGRVDITGTANTWTGNIKVTGGEVRFTGAGSLGNSGNTVTVDGGRFGIVSGGAVDLSARSIFLGATAGTSVSVPGAGGVLTYNGVLADKSGATGILVKQGAGALALGGASTFSGSVSINNGTIQLTTGDNRLPVGTTVNIGQAASVNTGFLDLNSRNQQIAGLVSTAGTNASGSKNTVTNSSGTTATLTLGGSGLYAYGDGSTTNSGIIAGAINLVVNGSGTNILGDPNTYTGNTTISAGTLALSGVGLLASTTNITVAAGGTLDVSGLTTALTNGNFQILKASGNGSAGTIATASSKGLTLGGTEALQFTAYNGVNAPLTVTGAGSVTLAAGNAVTVTVPGTALAAADYKLISKGSGNTTAVNGTVPSSVTVTNGAGGSGLAANTIAFLVVNGGELYLRVLNTYTVTYNDNGKTGGSVPTDNNAYTNGATVTVKSNSGSLVKAGSTFSGWNTQADGNGVNYAATGSAPLTMGSANVTLYAKWVTFPAISVSTGSLSFGAVLTNTASASQSYTISGANLTGNISINAPANFKVSTDNSTFASSLTLIPIGGTVATTNVYVQFNPTAQQSYSGTSITNTDGTDAITNLVAVTGTGAVAPTVTSSAATAITNTAATLNGNVTADGGATIADRGFVYGTTAGVTLANNKTTVSGTTGAFTLTPTLSPNVQYYFAAYAINAVGTNLSSPELSFWTLATTPAAPTVNGATTSSLNVTLGSDGNPSATTYAILETNSGFYVRSSDGALVGSADWQTASTWAGKTVTGLTYGTSYSFQVKARNGINVETVFGPATSASTLNGPFGGGNLVVERMEGTTSAGTPVSLVEYNTNGALQQTLSLPDAATRPTASPYNLMDGGSATSQGELTRSADGTKLVVPGYNGISSDSPIASSSAATVSRTIGVVNNAAAVDTSRSYSMLSGNNYRSVASTDGTVFWAGGAPGLVYVNASGTLKTNCTANVRAVNVFNNTLYYSTGSGTAGIYQVGTAGTLPTTATTSNLLITVGGSSPSPYGFSINPAGTVAYVADDRTVANGGGIIKYTNNSGTWSAAVYALSPGTGSATTFGARGLVVDWSGVNPVIYATTTEAGTNRLVAITDTGTGSDTATLLATAGATQIFRGIAFAPNATLTAQTIAAITPSTITKTYGNSPYSVATTASSGLTVTYASDTPAVATVDAGGNVTIVGAGTAIITASQAGNGTYAPATSVAQTLTVNPATPTMGATGGTFSYDGTPKAGSGTATGGAGEVLAVTLGYNGTGSTAYGPTATAPSAAGTYTVTASTAGDANNAANSSSAVALTINPATPIVQTPTTASAIFYGQTLSSSSITAGSFTNLAGATVAMASYGFVNPGIAPNAGSTNVQVYFVPTDTADYNNVTNTVTVGVGQATPIVQTPTTASAIFYGQTLSSSSITAGSFTNLAGATVAMASYGFVNPGIAPNAGSTNVQVYFVPTDTADYNNVTNTVTVGVGQATPIVQTPTTASAIFYGQTLANSIIAAGSFTNLAGATVTMASYGFVNLAIAPNAGSTNVQVYFVPTDAADYNNVTNTVTVTVNTAPASRLNGAVQFGGGKFKFAFTNYTGLSFSVLATNNLAVPKSSWPVVGIAVEYPAGSGNYQYTNTSATGSNQFYIIRQP